MQAWIAMAEVESNFGFITEAQNVYREAIETIPDSSLLRIAFAEFEEIYGVASVKEESTLEILRTGF